MKVLSQNRVLAFDMRTVCLRDIVIHLQQENFFTDDEAFHLIEIADDHYVSLSTRPNKILTSQIHEFRYLPEEKRLFINSRYTSWIFPGFFMMVLPLYVLGISWASQEWSKVVIAAALMVGIILLVLFFAAISLGEDSKNIEREITIRLNYLLRQ